MFLNTKYRSNEPEIMDDFAMEGEILRDALDKIAKINQLLGGNQLTLHGVQELIQKIPKAIEITIVDVGCGNGDMLRTLANFGFENNLNFNINNQININQIYHINNRFYAIKFYSKSI